jgi:hypothetical protein
MPTAFDPGAETVKDRPVKEAIDRLTKWIPGDALALYVTAVTAFAASDGARPSPLLLLVFVVLSAAFVIGAAFASTGEVPRTVLLPAVLAAVAFAIWTLSVPFSGWQRWDFVHDHQATVAIIAAVAGILFGFVADGFTKRAALRASE